MLSLILAATDSATDTTSTAAASSSGNLLMLFGWFALIIVVMYFLMIRPQKKKQKKEEAMRNNLQIGDEIVTIAGTFGRVVAIKEDSLIIESGPDRTKQKIARWAINQNLTVHDDTPVKTK